MFSRFGSKKDVNVDYRCTIRLLDDNEVLQFDFQRHHKGYHILEYVCKALNLIEKDYFGLRYVDASKQRHWLDCTKSIWKQIKGLEPIIFCFRVKFYPPDAYRLKEEITRYQMFLQLRRDLLHGRLYCSQSDSALLAAYIIQSELGDYDHEEHTGNYVAEFKLLLKQTPRLEEKIAEIHQGQLRGQVPAVAEMNFLRKACMLDTYGVDPHPVKDHKGNQLYLGINHAGILTFQGSRKTHHFKWVDIQKINYEGKMFIVHLLFSEKKHLIGFKCPTQAACQHLWRCAVEQRYFFNMTTSDEVPSVTTGGGIFSRASRFRFSGRVEKEIVEDMKQYKRDPPPFQRSLTMTSFRNKALEDSMVCPESPNSLKNVDRELYEKSDDELPNNSNRFTALHYNNQNSSIIEEPAVEAEEALIVTTETRDTIDFSNLDQEIASETKSNLIEIKNQITPTPIIIPNISTSISKPLNSIPATLPPPSITEENTSRFVEVTEESISTTKSIITKQVDVEKSSSTLKEKRVNHVNNNNTLLARPASAPATAPITRDYNNLSAAVRNPNKIARANNKAGGIRVLLVTSLSLLFILSCLLIFVLESDSPLFSDFRKIPEMIMLRREYYEPTKDYIASRVNVLFK